MFNLIYDPDGQTQGEVAYAVASFVRVYLLSQLAGPYRNWQNKGAGVSPIHHHYVSK